MPGLLEEVDEALAEHFGHRPLRASMSFVGVEPIEVLRFEPIPGERAYVTLGMARHPMTGAERQALDAAGPRAELVLHLADPADDLAEVWRRLAVLAAAPAVEGVVYVPGMSVDLGAPLAARSRCTGVVVTASTVPAVPTGAGDVAILRAVPATTAELAWCRVHGGAALLDRWAAGGSDLLDLHRPGVVLG